MIDEELTGPIIKAFYKVYNSLGYGFIESVYHNAMIVELVGSRLSLETKKPIAVYYGANVIGTFEADLVVEKKVILELKAKESLHPAHEAQLINYLRATEVELGLLFNFGRRAEFKRKYFSNKNKKRLESGVEPGILESLFKIDPPRSA